MRFGKLMARNVTRRPLRSGLTIVAVAIAICAVVALVGVSRGFEQSFIRQFEGIGVDLVVVKAGTRSMATSTLDQELGQRIAKVPGVKHVVPALSENLSFDEETAAGGFTFGWVPETVVFDHLEIRSGRALRREDTDGVMLGSMLASILQKKVGDTVGVFGERYRVVGIHHSSNVFENGAMIMPLATLQKLLDMEGKVKSFNVIVDKKGNADEKLIERVRQGIEQIAPGIVATPTREHVDKLTEIRVARAMAWITSTIALIVGAVGTLNTMVMAVHERTREMGILRAIGWRKSRILRMVLGESVLLSCVGGLLGVALAFGILQLLTRLPWAAGFVVRYVQPSVVLQGLAIAALVGLLGGLVPAYRATKVRPTQAIHYE